MPLTGQAHLQQVEGRLICLCTEAKGAKGEGKDRSGSKRERAHSEGLALEIVHCMRLYQRLTADKACVYLVCVMEPGDDVFRPFCSPPALTHLSVCLTYPEYLISAQCDQNSSGGCFCPFYPQGKF